MPSMANQTCSRHLNNSQLMKIRHPPELSYAAYGLKVYNQLELMIEIDSQLLKGKINRIKFLLLSLQLYIFE
jgi:hypothetical protein